MSRLRRHWWQFWRREPWWLPAADYDDDRPYGSSGRLDPDLWDYGRKSGWW